MSNKPIDRNSHRMTTFTYNLLKKIIPVSFYLVYTLLVRHGEEDVRLGLPGVGGEEGRSMQIIGWIVGLHSGLLALHTSS